MYFPAAFLGPIFLDYGRVGGPLWAWIFLVIVGQLAVMSVFSAASRLLRPWTGSRPWVVLSVIITAALVRGVVFTIGAWELGLAEGFEWRYRISSSLLFHGSLMLMSAIVVSSTLEHRRLIANLAQQRADLDDLTTSMQERLEELDAEIAGEVQRTIQPRIVELDAALASVVSDGDASETVTELEAFVDEELRPFSQELGSDSTIPIARRQIPNVRSRVPWLQSLSLGNAIMPRTTFVLAVMAAISPVSRDNPVDAIPFLILIPGVTALVMALVRLPLRNVNLPFVLVAPVVMLISALSVEVSRRVYLELGYSLTPNIQTAMPFVLVVIGGFTASYSLVVQGREATQAQLTLIVDLLQEQVAILRQHAWVARRRLSIVIHGSLQSALHAAAIRLASTSKPDPELIVTIRADIATAAAGIVLNTHTQPPITATLTEIRDLWSGVCEVDWVMDQRARTFINNSAVLSSVVAEIIREAVHNSAVHGGATTCDVTLQSRNEELTLTVVDNGAGPQDDVKPGLGSRMLDETCKAWSLSRSGERTVLEARLPMVGDISERYISV